jgi:K+ transporter
MARWRKRLFLAMANTATNPVDVFCLPEEQILTIGSYVEF